MEGRWGEGREQRWEWGGQCEQGIIEFWLFECVVGFFLTA